MLINRIINFIIYLCYHNRIIDFYKEIVWWLEMITHLHVSIMLSMSIIKISEQSTIKKVEEEEENM